MKNVKNNRTFGRGVSASGAHATAYIFYNIRFVELRRIPLEAYGSQLPPRIDFRVLAPTRAEIL